jgi:hypothetical protein
VLADTGHRASRIIATLAAYIVLVQFATQLQWHQFQAWVYDADVKEVARRIRKECRDKPGASIDVSVSALHQPALEFYRQYYGIGCAQPFAWRVATEFTGHDYYVYNRSEARGLETSGLRVLLSAPVSGITLAQ